jgi:alkylation response protein AidB-like acyl-CoA dehydrogenase
MRLDLNDDQTFFDETVRRFVETETPMSAVRERIGADEMFDRAWWRRGAELGFTSFLVDEANGGGSVSGRGPVDLVIIAEELGRNVVPHPLLPTNVVAETLSRHATPAIAGVIGDIVAGDAIPAWAGADGGISAEAHDNGFRLSGSCGQVEAADQADWLLVTASTSSGPTQFLVPADTTGVTIRRQESLDLLRHFARVEFDQVDVMAEATVGDVGGAAADVERQRSIAMLIQCAETCGAAARVLEFTLEWAFDRYSFGRPLASYQALKHRFADMKLWLEAAHAITDEAAVALSANDSSDLVNAAKSYVGDRSVDLIQDCVQLHGGIGVTWEHDIHLYLRRATVNRGLFGDPTTHRAALASRLGI